MTQVNVQGPRILGKITLPETPTHHNKHQIQCDNCKGVYSNAWGANANPVTIYANKGSHVEYWCDGCTDDPDGTIVAITRN
jgi:hypothetical protein